MNIELLALGMFAQDVVPPEQARRRWQRTPEEVRARWRVRAIRLACTEVGTPHFEMLRPLEVGFTYFYLRGEDGRPVNPVLGDLFEAGLVAFDGPSFHLTEAAQLLQYKK